MLMMVLRGFPGYTLSTIMEIPYSHFKILHEMTYSMDRLDTLTHLNAIAAPHDKNILQSITSVQDSRFMSRDVFNTVVTEQAKNNVNRFVK